MATDDVLHVYIYMCIYVYVQTRVHVYMYTCIHIYMYACIQVYMIGRRKLDVRRRTGEVARGKCGVVSDKRPVVSGKQ